jgi:hypothetical protein
MMRNHFAFVEPGHGAGYHGACDKSRRVGMNGAPGRLT